MTKAKVKNTFNPCEWVNSMESAGNRPYLQCGRVGIAYGDDYDANMDTVLSGELHADPVNLHLVADYLASNIAKYGSGAAPTGIEELPALSHLATGIHNGKRFYSLPVDDENMTPRHLRGALVRFLPFENASLRRETRDHVLHFTDGRMILRELVRFKSAHIGIVDGIIVRSLSPTANEEFIAAGDLTGIYPVIA